MSTLEDENFTYYYQRNIFKDVKDVFEKADSERKSLVQLFQASIVLDDNETSCLLLKKGLQKYSELTDDPSGINNYAQTVAAVSEQKKTQSPLTWTSGLQNVIENIIQNIPKTSCYSYLPQEALNKLRLSIRETPTSIQEPKKAFSFKRAAITRSDSEPDLQTNKYFKQENHNQICRSINVNQNLSKSPNISKLEKHKFQSSSNNYNNQGASTSSSKNFTAFKTARDELGIQAAKKYGSGHQQQPMFSYGGQKKALGTRRGVQNKFIPPDKNIEENPQQNNIQEETEVDERLKHIDPKMIELIRSEIMDIGTRIEWDDIAGLSFVKTTIQEAVVWPLLRPDIFTGLRAPPRGILLFGPPGTGKTLIGKCIASQSGSTFFSISASSLTSKWIGDGEKMVRALFAVAKCHQPAVVFIDEIDSLLSSRSDTEHEASRRMKTEFLVQLEGAGTADAERVLVVGATNRPQELDEAARRRLVRRLYVPLPDKEARIALLKRLISSEKNDLTEDEIVQLGDMTSGYSGADVRTLCAEAALGPVRDLGAAALATATPLDVRPIMYIDFKSALMRIRPTVSPGDIEQYIKWDNTYGAGVH